jgi:hypothetical protein
MNTEDTNIPRVAADAGRPQVSRVCPQCGTPFEPNHGKQWWCKVECYNTAHRAANRAEFLKQQAAYHAAIRERTARRNPALLAELDQKAERRIAKRRAFLAKWSPLDWSKQNCELADETGFNREYIRQIRRQVGAPQPTHPGRQRVTAEILQLAKDNLDRIKGLSWAEVERKYSLGSHWRSGLPHQLLKPFLRDGRLHKKHPWHLMNFRLPNSDLQRIWRLPYNMAGSYRYRKKFPPPKWPFKEGRPQFSGRRQLQAYQRAVKAEERKATTHFAQA